MIDLREHGGVLVGARSNMMVGEEYNILAFYPSYYYGEYYLTSNKGVMLKKLNYPQPTHHSSLGRTRFNDNGYFRIFYYNDWFDINRSFFKSELYEYNKNDILVSSYKNIRSTFGAETWTNEYGEYQIRHAPTFASLGDGYVYSFAIGDVKSKYKMQSFTNSGVLFKVFDHIYSIDKLNFINNTAICTMFTTYDGLKNTYNLDFTPVSNDFIAKQKSLSKKNEAEYLFNKQLFDAPR